MPAATVAGGACAPERPERPSVSRTVHAYRGLVVGGTGGTEASRPRAPRTPRVPRVRPNWWVILAVSLALMALLVATAGGSPHRPAQPGGARADSPVTAGHPPRSTASAPRSPVTTTTTSTDPRTPHGSTPEASAPLTEVPGPDTALTAHRLAASSAPASGAPATTTSAPPAPPAPPTTTPTTAAPSVAQPADRTQSEGYLDPPAQTSTGFGFTATGAMNVSVVWSGPTYLSMTVSCANGTQTVGGSSAMEASLPAGAGDCRATVSEPATESAAVTFTISIGPAGG